MSLTDGAPPAIHIGGAELPFVDIDWEPEGAKWQQGAWSEYQNEAEVLLFPQFQYQVLGITYLNDTKCTEVSLIQLPHQNLLANRKISLNSLILSLFLPLEG